MKKNYIAPRCEDVTMDALMAGPTFLGIATTSGGDAKDVSGAKGA